MRLFVGTVFGPSAQRLLDSVVKELVRRHHEVLRSVPDASAHLTYAFCAEADDNAIANIVDAVSQTADAHSPFEIVLGSPHVVSAGRKPRLVCAEVLSGQEALSRLTNDLLAQLRRTCPDLPIRPSRTPHVTLARFRKQAKRSDAQAVSQSLAAVSRDAVSAREQIGYLQVVSSTLTPSGAVYAIEKEFPLRHGKR
jgi:2'-5' RNA ligase